VSPTPRLRTLFAWVAVVALPVSACDSPPSASTLKEWTPADHDRAEETARVASGQKGGQAGSQAGANSSARPEMVVEAAWSQQCAACHGPIGHGDGPTGPMVHARDLTDPAWQASQTDEQMSAAIVSGKGKMPPFGNLPPKVIAGLVARIRATKGR
jgi:mono/diheme cytochrome c family protein